MRRPVIMDVANDSTAINALNAAGSLANIPNNLRCGEIVYNRVDLGRLTLAFPSYTVFDLPGPNIAEQLSDAAATFILGAGNTPTTFSGDGLVPGVNQVFTQLGGFGGIALPRRIVSDHDVIHTQASSQNADLLAELKLLNPDWFP